MRYILLVSTLFLLLGCSDKPIDAKTLFNEDCSNCHGKFARKSALGKSQVIAGFSKEQIKNAIIGYQEETYGGIKKAIMKKQVSSLNEEEIDVLSKYIYSLNH